MPAASLDDPGAFHVGECSRRLSFFFPSSVASHSSLHEVPVRPSPATAETIRSQTCVLYFPLRPWPLRRRSSLTTARCMEPSTASQRGYAEPLQRIWSPPGRPTVNTAIISQASSRLGYALANNTSCPQFTPRPLNTRPRPFLFRYFRAPTFCPTLESISPPRDRLPRVSPILPLVTTPRRLTPENPFGTPAIAATNTHPRHALHRIQLRRPIQAYNHGCTSRVAACTNSLVRTPFYTCA